MIMEKLYKCIFRILFIITVLTVVLVGCGSDDNKKKQQVAGEPTELGYERVWTSDTLSLVQGSQDSMSTFFREFCEIETHKCPYDINKLSRWNLSTGNFDTNLVISMEQATIPSEGIVAITIRDLDSPDDVFEGIMQGTFTSDYDASFQWNPNVRSLRAFRVIFASSFDAQEIYVGFYWLNTRLATSRIIAGGSTSGGGTGGSTSGGGTGGSTSGGGTGGSTSGGSTGGSTSGGGLEEVPTCYCECQDIISNPLISRML